MDEPPIPTTAEYYRLNEPEIYEQIARNNPEAFTTFMGATCITKADVIARMIRKARAENWWKSAEEQKEEEEAFLASCPEDMVTKVWEADTGAELVFTTKTAFLEYMSTHCPPRKEDK